jgi:hypothetical protein
LFNVDEVRGIVIVHSEIGSNSSDTALLRIETATAPQLNKGFSTESALLSDFSRDSEWQTGYKQIVLNV